jgi:hypothetical protein
MTTRTTKKSRYTLIDGRGGDRISDVPETLKEIIWGLESHFLSRLVSVQIGEVVYAVNEVNCE